MAKDREEREVKTSFGPDYIVVARWLAEQGATRIWSLFAFSRSLARSDERCKGERGVKSRRGEGRGGGRGNGSGRGRVTCRRD